MKFKARFRLWQVIVGLLCLGILFWIFFRFLHESGSAKETAEELTKNSSRSGRVLSPLFMFIFMVALFYFAINYFYSLLSRSERFIQYLKVIGIIVLASFAWYSFIYYNFPQALEKKYESLGVMFRVLLGNLLPMLFLSFIVAFVTASREAMKQRRILEEQKLKLEAQISQANFNFLKAQINPHFLHNTLNFLYAKSLPYSPELSEGILVLSDVMRYALNQGYQKEGKAPLKDEIEHVENVIKISQLRYSNQLKVNFTVTGEIEGLLIIPFVLITIVENAFKHGDMKSTEQPIDIRLEVKGRRLYFYCRNKKKAGPKALTTGIGLGNIDQRLKLAYSDKYKFTVKDETDFYTAELIIEML